MPSEFAAIADSLQRSPLMLQVSADLPGLSAIAHLDDEAVIAGTVQLLREHGLMDAKEMLLSDASVLLAASAKGLVS